MNPETFNESAFRDAVSRGVAAARKVLDNERYAGPGAHRALRFFAHLLFFRHPRLASEALHQYHDKFALAEWVVSQAGMAHIIVLEALGLNAKSLRTLQGWAGERAVTLALLSEERCVFNRETKREVESASYKRDYGVGTITDKVVTTITEWFWDFTVDWSLVAYVGNEPTDRIVLQHRRAEYEAMTTTKPSPRPEVRIVDPVQINVQWLLKHIGDGEVGAGLPFVGVGASHFLSVELCHQSRLARLPHAAPQRRGDRSSRLLLRFASLVRVRDQLLLQRLVSSPHWPRHELGVH